MGKPRTYTDEQFVEAVKTSMSYRQVLSKLGLKQAGGNYAVLKNHIKEMGLDTSHMTGQAHLRGKTHTYNQKPLERLLVEGSTYQSHKLKLRLLKEGYKEHRCEICGITEWNGQPTPIELDHIDGDHSNNQLDNLRIICPNCHAQTTNYRGKNKKCP